MGLFDDDLLEDDDYINAEVDDEEELELGTDPHVSYQPERQEQQSAALIKAAKLTNKPNRIVKKLPRKFVEKGVVSMRIVKKDGREIEFI